MRKHPAKMAKLRGSTLPKLLKNLAWLPITIEDLPPELVCSLLAEEKRKSLGLEHLRGTAGKAHGDRVVVDMLERRLSFFLIIILVNVPMFVCFFLNYYWRKFYDLYNSLFIWFLFLFLSSSRW